MRKFLRLGQLGGLAGFLIFLSACGHPPPRQIAPGEVNIRKVGRLYTQYTASQKARVGPESLDALKKFAESLDEKTLTSLDLKKEELASVFVSPRDNEPYGIVPKVTPFTAEAVEPKTKGPPKGLPPERGPVSISPPKAVVYEKSGAGGTHLVFFNNGDLRELSSSDFAQVVPNP
jgi:hypothetical protein